MTYVSRDIVGDCGWGHCGTGDIVDRDIVGLVTLWGGGIQD
jgi:hypothetical protein